MKDQRLRRLGAAACLAAALAAAWTPPAAMAQFRAPLGGERDGEGLRVPAPAPAPAPAAGGETTQCGCAAPTADRQALLASMQVQDEAFARAIERQGPPIATDTRSCVPYALSRDRRGAVQALAIHADGAEGDAGGWLLTLSRDRIEGAVLLQSERIDAALGDVTSVTATIEAVTTPAQSVRAALPPEVLSDLRTLLPMVMRSAGVRQESAYVVRIAFDVGTPERWARLLAVELIDRSTGGVVADTYWVDRGDLPGGFFNPDLGEFEHYFWTNPLSFTRISRGVGRSRLSFPQPRNRAEPAERAAKAAKGSKGNKAAKAGTGKTAAPKAVAPKAAAGKAGKADTGRAPAARTGRPVIQVGRHHIGVDYAAPTGTPVIAVSDGVVAHQGRNGAYGNLVVLSHAGGYTTYYAHLVDYAEHLRPGSEVRRGTEIGYVGSTGRSTGPHLHFEIRQAGRYLDPLNEEVDNGPWQWSPTDRLGLLRRMLVADALASTRPIPLAASGANPLPMVIRRCAQGG